LILIGLFLITYVVYSRAVTILSDHMIAIISISNHLAYGEAFHSNVHSMMIDVTGKVDKERYDKDRQEAEKALSHLMSYLDRLGDASEKRPVIEATRMMAKKYEAFKQNTRELATQDENAACSEALHVVQKLFDDIFKEYRKLHLHHDQNRLSLLSETGTIRKLVKSMLTVQLIAACILGLLVIIYFDRVVLKIFDLTEKLALHDKLTGLHNRHSLDRIISKIEKKRQDYGLILLDIDHFKRFNDSFGHAAGDQLLVKLAALLLDSVREQDRVIRIGGEEILILLFRADIDATEKVAEKIRVRIAETPFDLKDGEKTKRVTVSMGYAATSVDKGTFRDLMDLADKRLYVSKDCGRNMCTGRDK